MGDSQIFLNRTREALDEHRQIHFYLDQIAVTLEGLQPGLEDPEPMRRLAAQIEGLKERLTEHHSTEENGGLFQIVLEILPESRAEVGRLVKEHEKMIEILEMARLHAHCGEPAEADALRIDLEQFLTMFREHEHAEEALLERARQREQPLAE